MEQQLAPFQKRLRLVLAIRGAGWGFLIGACLTLLLSILDYTLNLQTLQLWPYSLLASVLIGLLISGLRPLPLPLLAATIDHAAGLGAGLTTALELKQKKHAFSTALQDSAFIALSKTSPKDVLPASKPPHLLNALLLLALALGFCYIPPLDQQAIATSLNQNASLSTEQSQKLADAATELRAKSDHEKDLRDIARETQKLANDLEREKLDLQSAFDKLGRLEDRVLALRETDEAQKRIREALENSDVLDNLKQNIAEKGKESSALSATDIQSLKDLARGDQETEKALKQYERAKSPLARRDAAQNLVRKLSQIKEQNPKLDDALKPSLKKLESALRDAQKALAANASQGRELSEDNSPEGANKDVKENTDEQLATADIKKPKPETPRTDPAKSTPDPGKSTPDKKNQDGETTSSTEDPSNANKEPNASTKNGKNDPTKPNDETKTTDPKLAAAENKSAEKPKDSSDPKTMTPDSGDPDDTAPKNTEAPGKKAESGETDSSSDPKEPQNSDKMDPKSPENAKATPEKSPEDGKAQPEKKNPQDPEPAPEDGPKNEAKDEDPAKTDEPSGGILQDLAVDMAKKVMDMGIEPPTDMLDGMDMDSPMLQDWAKSMVEKLIDSGFEVPKDFKPPKIPESMKNKEPTPEMKAWQKKIAEKLLKSGFKPPKNMKLPDSKGADKGSGQAEQWQKDFAQKLLDSGFKPSKELLDQAQHKTQSGGNSGGKNQRGTTSQAGPGRTDTKGPASATSRGKPNGAGKSSLPAAGPGAANSKFSGKYYSPKMSVSQDKNGQKKWVFAKEGGNSGSGSRAVRVVPGKLKPRSKAPGSGKKAVNYDSISGDSESRGKIPSGYKAYIKRYFEYQKDAKKQ